VTAKLFVVERYLPGITAEELRASADRLAAATEGLAARGQAIRYLGSAFVPEEESCFCRFEAASAATVERACSRARFPYARILEAETVADVTTAKEARQCARSRCP
jgi:Nickel responsive protein SCO4226-like